MAYATATDVRSLVDTSLTDPQITNIITWVDEVIDMKTDSGSLSATFKENLSASYAALKVMMRDPNARSLGEYSERRDVVLKMLKDEVDSLFNAANGGVSMVATMESIP